MMPHEMIMTGSYDYRLVALSIVIAMLGSYATINLAGRVKAARGEVRLAWQIGGAMAMAIGTWAMHYTGMLAFRLPVPISYDWPTSLLSFLPSVLASAVALIVVIRPKMKSNRAFVASIFIGGGIAALHYTAMESMRFQGMHRYSRALVILSVLLAMLFALLSIWLTFLFRDSPSGWKLRKVGSVTLMGTAIWAMHYTGMASASFMESDTPPDLSHAVSISFLGAVGIGAVALTVLTAALLTATLDRLQKEKVLLDELFEQAPQAVALMNADDTVVRVNRGFTRLFGYSSKEAIGRRLREMIVPDDLRDEVQTFIDMMERGEPVETDSVRQRKDGSRLDVSIVYVPVSLPGGQIARYAIFRDITERKQAEERLRATTEQLRALSGRLQSAREEEGARIARELHDELGSALTGLRWSLDEIDGMLSSEMAMTNIATVKRRIAGLTNVIDATLDAVRRISSELRPSMLDDLGMVAAIRWQAKQFQDRTGIACYFTSLVKTSHLTGEQSTAVFRILQEALTNITRHAQAKRVEIVLKEEEGDFIMTVSHNGKGITGLPQSGTEALGIIGMRERAHLIGGDFSITSAAGGGTVVSIRVPLASGAAIRKMTR